MLAFLTPVAAPLGISNPDFAVAVVGVLFFGTFAFLWSSKSYSAFFWAVVWIGIYVVLQTLLWPAYQSPETAKILSPWVSKFLIWSSAYLIPILFFLWPVNGGLKIKGFANAALRAVESGLVAVFAVAAVLTSGFGFMSQTYVFTADTAFTLLKDSANFTAFVSASKALSYLSAHMQAIVVSAVLFAIYKAFFSEIVSAAVAGAVSALMKRMKKWWGDGHDDHGWHDDHDDGHDDHGWHDDHGHWHH